jgi:hypothetical protein
MPDKQSTATAASLPADFEMPNSFDQKTAPKTYNRLKKENNAKLSDLVETRFDIFWHPITIAIMTEGTACSRNWLSAMIRNYNFVSLDLESIVVLTQH